MPIHARSPGSTKTPDSGSRPRSTTLDDAGLTTCTSSVPPTRTSSNNRRRAIVRNESPHRDSVNAAPTPSAVDRATFEARMATLRDWEKAHIRQGDALAAARRRLPMVEVDAGLELIGPDGPVTLLDAFDGRRQLLAYYFMWNPGKPAPEQCEGCTWVTTQVQELAYLHSRDITYAVFCQGPYDESV